MKKSIRKFTLNRNGTFFVNKTSSNQCKDTGHTRYKYHIELTCDDKLDKDDFIIDQLLIHQNILKFFKNTKKMHSCEKLCIVITELVEKLCFAYNINLDTIYCKILPLPFSRLNSAYMELKTTYTY